MAKSKGTKSKQAAAIKETEILDSVADLDLDGVSSLIGNTQVEVQQSLGSLSAKIIEKLQLLRNVEEAIDLKNDELKRLRDIEAKAIELDELDFEIEGRRREWTEEEQRKKREFEEQRSDRAKQWQREQADHEYQTQLERRKAQDDFAHQMALKEKENRDRQEQLEKDWAEREAELKKAENELAELREKAANMPEVIKKEVNAAVAVATNSVKKEYETKMQLAAKDAETAEKLATQEITSLKLTIDKLNLSLEELRRELAQAHADAKEISGKALESASSRHAMDELRKFWGEPREQGQKDRK